MSLLDNFRLPRKLDHAVRDVRDLSRRTFDFASDVYECLRLLKSVADEMTTRIDDVITSVAAAVTDHGDLAGLADDDHTQYSLVDGTRAFTGTVGGVTPVAGSDLATKDYVDGAAATDEHIQDVVGALVQNSSSISWVYQDGLNALAASVVAGSIVFSRMQDIATDTLIGRDSAGTGTPQSISVGGGVEFTGSAGIQRSALTGDVTASAGSNTTTIANGAVTLAKMANMATDRLLGRDTAGSGSPEEIALDDTLEFTGSGSIQRAALTGDVTANAGSNTTSIPNGSLGNVKLANMAGPSIKGRSSGTGQPSDLTRVQAHGVVHGHQTLSAASPTVTYDVSQGLYASVTLDDAVSATFDIDWTNLFVGARGTLRITTVGTVDLGHIEVAGVAGVNTPGGAAPSSLLDDDETVILEWFYDGELYVWIDADALANYAV